MGQRGSRARRLRSARSSRAGSMSWKPPIGCWHVIARVLRPEGRVRPRHPIRALQLGPVGEPAGWLQTQPLAGEPRRASAIRSLPWQTARRSRKSPRHAKGSAPTMSPSRSPGTSEPAASRSATANSMRCNQADQPSPQRSKIGARRSAGLTAKLCRTLIRLEGTAAVIALLTGSGDRGTWLNSRTAGRRTNSRIRFYPGKQREPP